MGISHIARVWSKYIVEPIPPIRPLAIQTGHSHCWCLWRQRWSRSTTLESTCNLSCRRRSKESLNGSDIALLCLVSPWVSKYRTVGRNTSKTHFTKHFFADVLQQTPVLQMFSVMGWVFYKYGTLNHVHTNMITSYTSSFNASFQSEDTSWLKQSNMRVHYQYLGSLL